MSVRSSLADKRDDVQRRVIAVVAKYFRVDKETVVRGTSLVHDLGADSLEVTELTMGLDEEFSVMISQEAAEKLLTIGDIVDHITGLEIDL